MNELILIEGVEQRRLEQVLRRVAGKELDREGSITELRLLAVDYGKSRGESRRGEMSRTFAVRPNRLCAGWDFSDLCCALKASIAGEKGVRMQAWFRLGGDTMDGLPDRQMLYVGFEHPSPDELDIVAPDGTRYGYVLYTEEETGNEFVQAEPTGKAAYVPRPKVRLSALPEGAGRYAVGRKRPFARVLRVRDAIMNTNSEWVTGGIAILYLVVFFGVIIVCITGLWDFSETVVAFSLPYRLTMYVVLGIGLLLAVLNVVFKKWNFLGRWYFSSLALFMVLGVAMVAVFSVNKWFASPEAVYGRGVVTAHEENRGSNNYHIEVLEPEEGKIFFRKQEEGYLRVGDTVHIAMHRGLYGLLHVESVDINR